MSLTDEITSTPEGLNLWHQERSIVEITEMVCEMMEDEGVSRKELADRIGKSKGYVTQLLDGTRNMTIRTISDVFVALNYQFHPSKSPLHATQAVATSTAATWSPQQYEFKAGTAPISIPFSKGA